MPISNEVCNTIRQATGGAICARRSGVSNRKRTLARGNDSRVLAMNDSDGKNPAYASHALSMRVCRSHGSRVHVRQWSEARWGASGYASLAILDSEELARGK